MKRPIPTLAIPASAVLALAALLAAGPALAAGPCVDGVDSACADRTFDPQPATEDSAPAMLERIPAGSAAPLQARPRAIVPAPAAEPAPTPPPPPPPADQAGDGQ